ncbi:redoxin family protein [Rhizobium sp. NLR11b]|uniref:redoxin family protein n=2 Tax=Rhizobium TaxID=379 RepID=UPI001C82B21C|nr:redoxin family protein [Rhizobium sp. NLR11b]MBX5314801.1 redoxin family protein [Rhizobium sp. NLR11b]
MTSSLNSGSPAPSIKVQHWLRGDPLPNFKLGKIYIPAFVSTTCSGCGPALARLAQLHEQYRDIGIEVIGIVANNRTAMVDEALAEVDAWVTKWLPNANIRIGFDYSGEMDEDWLKASLSSAVPRAFVVDLDGRIAFIGDLVKLEDVLPKVIDGSWRASAEAKSAEEERIAEAEIDATENALRRRIRAATDIEDWKTALSAIEEGIILFPDNIKFHQKHVEILIGVMRDMEAGWIALVQFARTAIERNSEDWLSRRCEPTPGLLVLPFAREFRKASPLCAGDYSSLTLRIARADSRCSLSNRCNARSARPVGTKMWSW